MSLTVAGLIEILEALPQDLPVYHAVSDEEYDYTPVLAEDVRETFLEDSDSGEEIKSVCIGGFSK